MYYSIQQSVFGLPFSRNQDPAFKCFLHPMSDEPAKLPSIEELLGVKRDLFWTDLKEQGLLREDAPTP